MQQLADALPRVTDIAVNHLRNGERPNQQSPYQWQTVDFGPRAKVPQNEVDAPPVENPVHYYDDSQELLLHRGYAMVLPTDIPKAAYIIGKVAKRREGDGFPTRFKWLTAKMGDVNPEVDPGVIVFGYSRKEIEDILKEASEDPLWAQIEDHAKNENAFPPQDTEFLTAEAGNMQSLVINRYRGPSTELSDNPLLRLINDEITPPGADAQEYQRRRGEMIEHIPRLGKAALLYLTHGLTGKSITQIRPDETRAMLQRLSQLSTTDIVGSAKEFDGFVAILGESTMLDDEKDARAVYYLSPSDRDAIGSYLRTMSENKATVFLENMIWMMRHGYIDTVAPRSIP